MSGSDITTRKTKLCLHEHVSYGKVIKTSVSREWHSERHSSLHPPQLLHLIK